MGLKCFNASSRHRALSIRFEKSYANRDRKVEAAHGTGHWKPYAMVEPLRPDRLRQATGLATEDKPVGGFEGYIAVELLGKFGEEPSAF